MPRAFARMVAVLLAMALVAVGCGGADGDAAGGGAQEVEVDYEAIGLWDDGPCDEARNPLVIGLTTVFESPVVSLRDQATALEAAAEAFNARGGANGACIEVHTCDDGANVDQAVACVREMDRAGVMATVNDEGTAGAPEVSAAMADAGIPRIASSVTFENWDDQNSFPLDASGTGQTFLTPRALIEAGADTIGLIRVDLPNAAALVDLIGDIYADDASFPSDVPVPAGTTDFSQFILGAQDADAEGIMLALGEQEAVQVVRAGQQLGTDMLIGGSLGTFPHGSVSEFGDFADQMVFLSSYPPATVDVPVYEALRQDLAASGDEALQPQNLKTGPMQSWIGLYALIRMIRDAGMNEFSREGISAMVTAAQDIPMLDIFGGEDWTPDTDHGGLFTRAGVNHWAVYRWDADADNPVEGLEGNFVEDATMSFDEVLCGSPVGPPEPC
jgi:ABC-type branched-subunit amino acid transport system substrate-binding protein